MNFQEDILSKRKNPDKFDFNHEKIKQWSRWKTLQRKTYVRDNFICRKCNVDFKSNKTKLTVNHIVPASKDNTKWFDLENLETMCNDCHRQLNIEQQQLENNAKTNTM